MNKHRNTFKSWRHGDVDEPMFNHGAKKINHEANVTIKICVKPHGESERLEGHTNQQLAFRMITSWAFLCMSLGENEVKLFN